jgi:hypothetical protein
MAILLCFLMKKINYLIIVIIVIVIAFLVLMFLRGFNGGEDNWIKDSKGMWVKHGNPSNTPTEVLVQEEAIKCAKGLYEIARSDGLPLNSQCLGTCTDYAVDIVNVPRNSDDDLVENQCASFKEGKVMHFIELDKEGKIVRIG